MILPYLAVPPAYATGVGSVPLSRPGILARRSKRKEVSIAGNRRMRDHASHAEQRQRKPEPLRLRVGSGQWAAKGRVDIAVSGMPHTDLAVNDESHVSKLERSH